MLFFRLKNENARKQPALGKFSEKSRKTTRHSMKLVNSRVRYQWVEYPEKSRKNPEVSRTSVAQLLPEVSRDVPQNRACHIVFTEGN